MDKLNSLFVLAYCSQQILIVATIIDMFMYYQMYVVNSYIASFVMKILYVSYLIFIIHLLLKQDQIFDIFKTG